MSKPTWREQYDRMKRWHARLTESNEVNDRRVDDFYAFFTCCFHLKDWLKADLGGAIGEDAEAMIASRARPAKKPIGTSLALLLSADIANGSKHFVIDRAVRVDETARVETTMRAFQSLWPADQPVPDLPQDESVVVLAFGQAYEAMTMVEDCLETWDNFLRERGLL